MDKETFEKVAKISEDMKSLWLVIKKKYRAVPLYHLLVKEVMKFYYQVLKKMQSKIFSQDTRQR